MVAHLETLSPAEARRIALAAQGFTHRPEHPRGRTLHSALGEMHVLQIDSVNVFVRSHYLPLFSRLGGFASTDLDQILWASGEYTEYWGHEAAFIPVRDRPLFAWRMAEYQERFAADGRAVRLAATVQRIRGILQDGVPRLARELEDGQRSSRGPWWDWSETKHALELMFAQGEVASAGRTGFQRRYALAELQLPPAALGALPRSTAHRILIERAAGALGVATLADLADYHRLRTADARPAVQELEDEGVIVPVAVRGWRTRTGDPIQAWMHRDARAPARLAPDALLSPFDPTVWCRPRTERLFDFHYRIEIYTPKAKRRFGYYCLPLMVAGRLVGRVDLKADRAGRELLVQAAWQEDGAPSRTAETARRLIARVAAWQGLDRVSVSGVGNLALPARFDAS